MPILKKVLFVLAFIGITLASAITGLVIGALIGGNYASNFTFNGVQGYEVAGQLGLILGAVIGVITSWFLLYKRDS